MSKSTAVSLDLGPAAERQKLFSPTTIAGHRTVALIYSVETFRNILCLPRKLSTAIIAQLQRCVRSVGTGRLRTTSKMNIHEIS